MNTTKPRSPVQNIVQFTAIFLLVYITSQFVLDKFFPQTSQVAEQKTAIMLTMVDSTITRGHNPEVKIVNPTQEAITLTTCPTLPFTVEIREEEEWLPVASGMNTWCDDTHNPMQIEPNATVKYSLAPWKYSYFAEVGTYRLSMTNNNEVIQTQFTLSEPGAITGLFRAFITKPLLNALVFVASITPGYNLGVAIVIVTVLIKILLFFPTQSALKSQRKLQAIQPKIDALRTKHKDDPQALNKATLELWRTEKVNPFQSCLPLLLQFPVLLGLFFVVRDGSILKLSQHLLYTPFQNLPWSFGTNFLWLDLTVPNIYVLPLLLVVLQFAQLKLSFAHSKAKTDIVDVTPAKDKKKPDMVNAAEMQKKVMLYVLPLMIGFFAIQFPAAVSLYWAVSTIFAIGQQFIVNKHVK